MEKKQASKSYLNGLNKPKSTPHHLEKASIYNITSWPNTFTHLFELGDVQIRLLILDEGVDWWNNHFQNEWFVHHGYR